MTAAPLPRLVPSAPWTGEPAAWGRTCGTLGLSRGDGIRAVVRVERCAAGRLRGAYPAGGHDVEIAVTAQEPATGAATTEILRQTARMVWKADGRCRRIVLAVPPGDAEALASARAAGFRLGVDVDLPDEGTVDLLVAEPPWAAAPGPAEVPTR